MVTGTLYTIGFAGKTAEEFFLLLERAGIQRVVDIRENRIGQLSGFAKYPDLAFFLQRLAQIKYQAEPLLAPSAEIRKSYRSSKNWDEYEAAFLALMKERGVPEILRVEDYEGRSALLCSEPTPEKCHRRLVADLLSTYWNTMGHELDVRHLVAESIPKRRGRTDGRKRTTPA